MENGAFDSRKCSIFHKIFKYIVFQRSQNALSGSQGLKERITLNNSKKYFQCLVRIKPLQPGNHQVSISFQ